MFHTNFYKLSTFKNWKISQENPKLQLPGGPVAKDLPSSAGDMGSAPGWGTKIPYTVEQLSPSASTREPVSCNH